MKRIFIVHGWSGRSDVGWMKWINKEITSRGFNVTALKMPDPDFPKIEPWVNHLSKIVGIPDEETFFIGHSIGCQTIIRYLERLPEKSKIGGAIFVAGWFKLQNLETQEEKDVSESWLNTPVDFGKVKSKIGKTTVILSDDDVWVNPEENGSIFKEKIGSKVIIDKNKGHYIEKDIKKIHSLLDEILRIIN